LFPAARRDPQQSKAGKHQRVRFVFVDGRDSSGKLGDIDARLCYPIEDLEYGMCEFAIYDNNGCIL
jgi:hypothetical protein